MRIIFNHKPGDTMFAEVVDELPNIGEPFRQGLIHTEAIKTIEPYPYQCPQEKAENYLYSLWKITYAPMLFHADICTGYLAIHEKEAEKI